MTVNPISSSLAQSAAVVASSPAKPPTPSASSASSSSPAATVSISGRPASVDADDQAAYSQALSAARGNVDVALASVAAQDKSSGES